MFFLLGNNLVYGQTDSVLLSIDEVRVVAKVLNENNYLRKENSILDSIIIVNNKHINLLNNSISNYMMINNQQLGVIHSFEEIDRLRVQQINNMMLAHKKDKRMTAIKFGGGGIAVGMILMLILK